MNKLIVALFLALGSFLQVAASENFSLASVICPKQKAQDFLIRHQMFLRNSQGVKLPVTTPERRQYFLNKLTPSIMWRFRTYGYPPLPDAAAYVEKWKEQGVIITPVEESLVKSTFLGYSITVHKKALWAFQCAQREIEKNCQAPTIMCDSYDEEGICRASHSESYKIKRLSTWRGYDSYKDEEFSNHNFGLAIDIDPDRNPCCGTSCAPKWHKHPRCRWNVPHPKRSDIPLCWVNAFKNYGFIWLAEDRDIGDTMHFEFLGTPLI